MLRVLLSCMVPCVAIGLTGLIVSSIGRLLLFMSETFSLGLGPGDAPTLTALILTIAIMAGASLAATVLGRRNPSPHH